MYLRFFELNKRPFANTPDPEFLYNSFTHREALAKIITGIDDMHGFVAVIGDVGLGKTTVIQAYLQGPHAENTHSIVVYNPDVTFDELLTVVYRDLGMGEKPETTAKAVDRLHVALLEFYKRDEKVVLIIDEAQNIPVSTLEKIRMLSNLETAEHKLLQIVLCGQTEFGDMLNQHNLRQLRQRISLHARLEPLSEEDSCEYVKYRLQKAAYGNMPIMKPAAIKAVARASGGIPRVINILADHVLTEGVAAEERPVSAKTAELAISEYKLRYDSPALVTSRPVSNRPSTRRIAMWAVPSILVIAAAVGASVPSVRETMVSAISETDRESTTSPPVAVVPPPMQQPPREEEVQAEPAEPTETVVPTRAEQPPAPPPVEPATEPTRSVEQVPPTRQDEDRPVRASIANTDPVQVEETQIGTQRGRVETNVPSAADDVPETQVGSSNEQTESREPTRYIVQPGDYLTRIIRNEYGEFSTELLRIVRDANPDIRDINVLRTGEEVVLPPPPQEGR